MPGPIMGAGSAAARLVAGSLLLLVFCQLAQHTLALPAAEGASTQLISEEHISIKPGNFWLPQLLHIGSTVAPVLNNYTFSAAADTFHICRQQGGARHDVSQEELMQQFGLPKDLHKQRFFDLPQLVELLHAVQPEFRVEYEPMLSAETDIGRLVDPSPQTHPLPKMVHFTVKDKNKLRPHQVLSMASWAHYNPGYRLMLFDDDDIRAFMNTYYADLLPTFDALGSPVERADMWRYLVLCKLGGVYADSDVMAARPISQWAQDAGLLVGIENVFTTPEEARLRSYSRQVQMVQWAIASRPGHPVVCRMGQHIAQHVAEEQAGDFVDADRDHAILERTGPGIWSDSVHKYLKEVANASAEDLVGGGLVGDVRVFPQPVFGCPTSGFDVADPLPYVYHMFMGSWKKTTPFGLTVFIRKLSSTLHKQQQQQQPKPQPQPHEHQDNRSAAGTVVDGVAASNGSTPAAFHHNKNPRRPILDEQIAQHRLQQQQQQQQQQEALLKQHSGKLETLQLPGLAQPLASTSPAAVVPPLSQQQEQQQAKPAAAGTRTPSTRKLRSSQVLLVRGAAMAVPNMQGLWLEPDVPSKNLGELHTVFLLVVAAVLLALCKRRGGGACTGLWAAARDGMKRVRSSSGAPSRGTLTRPLSRTHLGMGSGGSALLINTSMLPPTPAGAGAASSSSGSSDGSLSPVPEAVCYSSSQSVARASGHKRSWGSGSNFQL